MKHFIILVCFLMAFWTGPATGARQQLRSDVVYNERNLKEGRYKYGYAVKQGETQFHHQRSLDGAMYGCYGYVDPLGKLFITHYLADKAGYRLVNLANPDKRLLDKIRSLGSAEHPLELQSQFPLECQADGDIKVLQETAAQMTNTLSAQALQGNVRERSSLSYKTTTSSTSNLKEQVEDKPVNQNQPVAPTVSGQGLKKNLISQADPEVKKTVGNGNGAQLSNTNSGTYKTVAVSFKARQSPEGRNIFKSNVRSPNTGKSFGSPFSMVGSDGSTYIPVAVIDSNDRPLGRLIPLRGAGAAWYPTAAFRRSSDTREPVSVNTAVEEVKTNQLIDTLKKIEEPVIEGHGIETKNQKTFEAAKVDLEVAQATSVDMGVDEVNKVAVENGSVKTSIDMKHEENVAEIPSKYYLSPQILMVRTVSNDDERSYALSQEQQEVLSAVRNTVESDESVLHYSDSTVNTNTAGHVHDVPDAVHEAEEAVKSAEISNSDFTDLSEEPQEQQDIQGRKIDGSVEDINRNGPEKSDSFFFNSEIDTQSGLSAPEVVHIPAIRVPEYVERQVLNTDSNLPSQDYAFSTRTDPVSGSQLDSETSSVNNFGGSAREVEGENVLDDSEVVEAYDDSHPLMIPKLPATPRTTTDGPAGTVTISYSYSNAGKPPVLPRPTTGYRPSVSNTYFQATTTTTAKPGRTTIGPSGDIYDEVEEDIPPPKPIAPPRPISPPRPVQMSPQIPSKPSSSNSEYSIQPSISSSCYEVVLQVPVDAKQVLLKTESPEFRVFGDGDPANRIRQVQPGVYEVNIGATSGIKFRQYPQFQHKDANKLALDIAKGFNYGDLVPKPANRGATDLRDATLNNPYLPLVSIESAQDVGSVELVTVGADSHELSQEQRALLGLVPSWKKVLLYY
nr:uncharacterized protein LOC115266850 [Aedes albopictus]